MAVRKFKPTTPTRRHGSVSDFAEITADKPYGPLTKIIKKSAGRNNHGHITAPRRGGGAKKRYRMVDFKRLKHGVTATVQTIEYDPNRTARIALVEYEDGEKSYILAPNKLKVGAKIESGPATKPELGNHVPIGRIPLGTFVHNIELRRGAGAKLVRSAGNAAQLMSEDDNSMHVKMPSGEVRMIKKDCFATVGQCSNPEANTVKLGKAGRNRWKGKRPRNRAVARNPVDHPMGGGEGKSSGGRHPVSKNGIPAKGFKTRKKSKVSTKFIIKHRRKK